MRHLPTVLISIALILAAYFAIFGKSSTEENPTPQKEPVVASLPEETLPEEPTAEPLPEPELDIEPEPTSDTAPVSFNAQKAEWKELDSQMEKGNGYDARPLIEKLFFSKETTDRERLTLADLAIKLNTQLLLVKPDPRDVIIHEVKTGEVLTTIARKYTHLKGEWGIIPVLNNMSDPSRLRVGKKLRIPKGTWSLYVDKSLFRLWLLYEQTPFKEYEIAIGKEDKTPAVTFKVFSKTPKPDWYPPAYLGFKESKINYGDPRNPLGNYWIAIDHPAYDGYGIHGTNDEAVIGTAASNGCIRMHNYEIEEMAHIAFTGMDVTISE